MRGCMTVGVVLVAIVVFLGVVGAFLLTRPSTLGAGITPVAVSSAAVGSFDRKYATAQAAAAPVTVEITDEEATSKLVLELAREPGAPRIEGAQVNFRGGKVYLSGTSREGPIPVRIVIVGRVEARDGQVVPVVEQIDTGRVPLPASVRDQIAEATTNLDALNADLPLYVTEVRVLDGRMQITGRPK